MEMLPFRSLQASRPGHFNGLRTGELSPLPVLPFPREREPGDPPFPNTIEMTKAFQQSLLKRDHPHLFLNGVNYQREHYFVNYYKARMLEKQGEDK